jgi:ubiquitin-activating enzyme E1 C
MSNESHGFADNFEGDADLLKSISINKKILVVGAGRIGCEILKDLALTGLINITIVDQSTVDKNYKHNFMFQQSDLGKSKAFVAASYIMIRHREETIKWI